MTEPATIGRRERNKAAKQARILAAASERLKQDGYDRMTMAQVAEDADVAIGTVFQYAATKAELLMMVTADRWADAIPAAVSGVLPEDDPVARLRALLAPVLEASRTERDITAAIARELLFGAGGPHRDAVVAIVAQLEVAVAEALREAGAGSRTQAAARLVVSGGLLEVNRTRTGRASAESVEERLSQLIQIAVDGARAG